MLSDWSLAPDGAELPTAGLDTGRLSLVAGESLGRSLLLSYIPLAVRGMHRLAEIVMVETTQARKHEAVLSESVARLRTSMQAERIYLFGSQARGDATEDSDYDFLVVVNDSSLPRFKREQQAFRALWGLGVAKDVLVFTRREFNEGLEVVSSLPATVVREGRLIYGG